jgi:hypothetical protein
MDEDVFAEIEATPVIDLDGKAVGTVDVNRDSL